MSELVIVLVTAPRNASEDLAKSLVDNRLAACVNIVGPVRSIYWWQGKVERDEEDLLVIKTKRCLIKELKRKIRELHPYTVPEIVAIKPVDVLRDYEAWALGETRQCGGDEQ
ncbi:MAG: divalent-cation tolerance protein CutA [Desulfurococcales archaeon]|nr:divalent-cation tolerance protein CutA [Desulfurococcales archaeon]